MHTQVVILLLLGFQTFQAHGKYWSLESPELNSRVKRQLRWQNGNTPEITVVDVIVQDPPKYRVPNRGNNIYRPNNNIPNRNVGSDFEIIGVYDPNANRRPVYNQQPQRNQGSNIQIVEVVPMPMNQNGRYPNHPSYPKPNQTPTNGVNSYPTNPFLNNQYSNNQYPNNHYPNNQYPNNQYPNNQYPNNQYPNNQYPNNQYPNSQQYPNNQYPSKQFPNNQYPDNQYPNDNNHDSNNNKNVPYTSTSPSSVLPLKNTENDNKLLHFPPTTSRPNKNNNDSDEDSSEEKFIFDAGENKQEKSKIKDGFPVIDLKRNEIR